MNTADPKRLAPESKRPLRIVIAHNHYQQTGGEDQVFTAEVALLRSRGHTVIPYAVHNDAVKDMGSLSLAVATVWNRKSYQELRQLFREERPDIVHVHNTQPLISPAIYYAAQKAGAAVVQTLHNFRISCPKALLFRDGKVCEDCLGRTFAWPGIRYACYRGSRAATAVSAASSALHRLSGTYAKQVDRYIALTEFGAEKARQGGLPASRISVKPNFLADDPGIDAGQGGYALFVGRLSSEKGINVMLKAFQNESTMPLKVVGVGPEEEQVSQASEEVTNISQLGEQPRSEVLRLMGEAAVLIFPSEWYEGFPMTIVEALSCGLPVIASKLGGMASIIEHGQTGLHFKPGDVDDLRRQVRWAMEHPDALNQMRQNARRTFEENYTAEWNYKMLMEIYRQAMLVRADPQGS